MSSLPAWENTEQESPGSPSGQAPGLELRRISKSMRRDFFRPAARVVSDLSCRFPAGQCTGFMGHNGAGKTTTIRMILGLLRPDQGEILLDGRPLTRSDRRRIGYMPENDKLRGRLTPAEILRYQLSYYGFRGNRAAQNLRVRQALQQVGLEAHQKQLISRLSKGMGRRLCWAMATIHNPRLLILDEPFSGLDPAARLLMKGWITALRRADRTIILCTHETETMLELCDQFHIIRTGQLIRSGTDEDALHEDAGYRIDLSGLDPGELDRFKARGLPSWTGLDRRENLISLSLSGYANASAWLQALLGAGVVVTGFRHTGPASGQQWQEWFSGGTRV